MLSLLLLAVTAGCGPGLPATTNAPALSSTTANSAVTPSSSTVATTTVASTTTSAPASSSTTSETAGTENQSGDYDQATFSEPAKIDNEWYPLKPGTQLEYQGYTEDEGRVPHKITFIVTDLTKVINGVQCVVVWDRDLADGRLEEAELAFFAQDDSGNVWQLGEYPEAYEDGELVEAPAWISGIQGAKAGIMMKTAPKTGEASYPEGWGPAVNWADRAQVAEAGVSTTVAAGTFNDVIVIKEYSEDEPGAFQLKYYASGVGVVRVGWGGTDETKETLELTKVANLDATALATARAQALELEQHAYVISKDVYAKTAPAVGPGD